MSPQGRRPAHISRTTHPRLQISTLAEYPCPLTECTTSGAIQNTEPFKLVEMIESYASSVHKISSDDMPTQGQDIAILTCPLANTEIGDFTSPVVVDQNVVGF